MIKCTGFGVLTAVAILIALDFLPSLVPGSLARYRILDIFYFWPAVEGAFVMFVAAFGGAYVAKVRFVVPAVVLAAVIWAFVVYLANSIAAAAGQGDLLAAAGSNILGLILCSVGAATGAGCGKALSRAREGGATR